MTSHMFNPFNPRQNPIICFGIILCHLRPYLASELPIFYIFSRIWQISLPYPPHFFHHFPTFSHGFAAVPSTSKARSSRGRLRLQGTKNQGLERPRRGVCVERRGFLIGLVLRENLQETMVFTIKYRAFL